MSDDPLHSFYKRARNRLRRFEPESMLVLFINALREIQVGGVAVMRHYRPWEILLAMKLTLQEADGLSHRRPAAKKSDMHEVLNILH